ncbi:ATP-binding protein [Agrobacterium sp. S2]|nr:ATP-binding protein [Agrobacterium sp. S2]
MIVDALWAAKMEQYNPRPRLINQQAAQRVAVHSNGEFDLPFRVELPSRYAPATGIYVIVEDSPDADFLGGEPYIERLEPGQTHTAMQRCVVRSHNTVGTTVRFRAQLRLKNLAGNLQQTPIQTFHFELVSESVFENIPNPYSAYAGGTAVADPDMFFGRTSLMTEMLSELRDGPVGQGFALYGQKRSGKTSLVEQLQRKCDAPPSFPSRCHLDC